MNQTASKLLDAAQKLVQQRGYNAFSYKDLAEIVGIRTSSIHYHFESKSMMGQAMMERYSGSLERALAEIDQGNTCETGRLTAFIDLYRSSEASGIICLCGSLASDAATLPTQLQCEVSEYLDRSERWVTARIQHGLDSGEFTSGDAVHQGYNLVAALQGGLILARVNRSSERVLDHIAQAFFAALNH